MSDSMDQHPTRNGQAALPEVVENRPAGYLRHVVKFVGEITADRVAQPGGAFLVSVRFEHGTGSSVYALSADEAKALAAMLTRMATGIIIGGPADLT